MVASLYCQVEFPPVVVLRVSHCTSIARPGVRVGGAAVSSPDGSGIQHIPPRPVLLRNDNDVGYGDITPQNDFEMIFAVMAMVLGVGMFGYVIGNVAHIISNLHPSRARYVETMERINAFMEYRGLPDALQHRIREYHGYRWEKRLGFDESVIVDELPPSLRAEVSLFLKKDVIEKVPLFKGAGTDLIRDIALAMHPLVYLPGDYIFRAGDQGKEMFFIGRGTVEILGKERESVQATLGDGQFFGEVALVKGQPRNASVRAVGYCDLYSLDKETFDRIIAHHPDFKEHIDQMVKERFTG